MSGWVDLTGRRVGVLKVLAPLAERCHGSVIWRCRCECGGERTFRASALMRGRCGGRCTCQMAGRRRLEGSSGPGKAGIDLTGQQFGVLTALAPTAQRRGSSVVWRCRCECGSERLFAAGALGAGQCGKQCTCIRHGHGRTSTRAVKQSDGPGVQALDLTGQQFGVLTAVAPTTQRRRNGSVVWRCRCECGAERLFAAGVLAKGSYGKRCTCKRKHADGELDARALDLTGRQVGVLTVLAPTEKRRNGSVIWRCRCECGTERTFRASELAKGRYGKRCTCKRKHADGELDARALDLTGRQVGVLTVLAPLTERRNGSVMWRCRCECGAERLFRAGDLATGHTGRRCTCDRVGHDRDPGAPPVKRPGEPATQALDLTGWRVGVLTVLAPTAERRRNGSVIWRCRCECGAERLFSSRALKARRCGKQCTCDWQKGAFDPKRASLRVELAGRRFGQLTVKGWRRGRLAGEGQVAGWQVRCDCGAQGLVKQGSRLQHGQLISCGCDGVRRPSPHFLPLPVSGATETPPAVKLIPLPKFVQALAQQVQWPLWRVEVALPGDRVSWVTEEHAPDADRARRAVLADCPGHVVVSVQPAQVRRLHVGMCGQGYRAGVTGASRGG